MTGKILSCFSFIASFMAVASSANAQAALEYQISVQQVEFCQTGSSVDTSGSNDPVCVGPVIVGSGIRSFDIASVSAGAAVGQYASVSGLAAGQVFTHIRTTLSRTINIRGLVAGGSVNTGGGAGGFNAANGCRTNSADNSAANNSPGIGGNDGAASTTQRLVVPDVGSINGEPTATAMRSRGTILVSSSTMTVVQQLPQPVVITSGVPTVRISFNTQSALQAFWNQGATECQMFPDAPVVSIAVQ